MTTAAPVFETADFLRVESVFARTYDFVRRQAGLYLLLVLALGVAPSLLVSWMTGTPPGDLRGASLTGRIGSMALFVVSDAALCALLAKATLDGLVGRPVSLSSALDIAPDRIWPLLAVTAAVDAPILSLNLASSLITQDPALGLVLYGLRFAVGVSLGAVWCGAGAIVLVDGLGPMAALRRAAALTAGHRWRVALFFAAFFLLKVLGPYMALEWGLRWLAPDGLAGGVAATVVWNVLACALGVATTLIYADLTRLNRR